MKQDSKLRRSGAAIMANLILLLAALPTLCFWQS